MTAVQLQEPGTHSSVPTRTRGDLFHAWLPTALWLCVIAIESTEWLSAHHTSRFLYPFLHWLFGLTPAQFEPIHAIMRKSGHVLGYGTLSVLAFRSFRASSALLRRGGWSMASSRNAVLLTAAVASLDEWHQTFLPSRTGTIRDVFLDTAAALAAQGLVYVVLRPRSPE